MVKIVPKSKSKTDFFSDMQYFYIVRPDLACYMRCKSFNTGEDVEIFSLHPACRNGDHYLADTNGNFYIIQSNYYRRVSNLSTDEGGIVYTLHPDCQGGDHYCSIFDVFFIIFQEHGVIRAISGLDTGIIQEDKTLHPECKNGLYYFGALLEFCFVKPGDEWGIQYSMCRDLSRNTNAMTFSFHPSIYSFLPGGLAVAKGASFGEWVSIKTIRNDTQTPLEYKKRVTKKTGYEKGKTSSIEHNWKVSASVSAETGGLASLIAKAQFSLSAEYGGSSTNTEKENWNEATEVEETITVVLKPQEKIYIYVYRMGLGTDPVLHCRDMRILDSPTPPTDNPLPRAV